ncbi:MAG: replication-associated recombination protein A, partial [Austwickia sp.]|nr:replication-associated recombination protein A [Austwickia sp.]
MDEPDLFADATAARTPRATVPAAGASAGTLPPLAVRMRPGSLSEVRGQRSALRPGSPLRRL